MSCLGSEVQGSIFCTNWHSITYAFALSDSTLGILIQCNNSSDNWYRLSGIRLMRNADGHAVLLWGLELPLLIAENPSLAGRMEELHETIGNAGYYLIGLHALGALFHHYVRHDNTLQRMRIQSGRR